MDGALISWLIFGAFALVLIVAATPIIIRDFKKNKEKLPTKEELLEREEERLNSEGELITVHAEVTNMNCGVRMVGHKEPKTVKHFVIDFSCDDGEVRQVYVSETFYEGFEVGLAGMLTLVDGQLKSFEPDEEEV